MKRVAITYRDLTLCEADDVEQFSFTETDEGVQVAVKFRKQKPARHSTGGGGGGGLMDLLAAASKSKTKPDVIEGAG